jgi:hypothetical protein
MFRLRGVTLLESSFLRTFYAEGYEPDDASFYSETE